MRTKFPGTHHDSGKLHRYQARVVRLPSVRLRGTVAVRVASTATPSPRGLDARARPDGRGSAPRRARSDSVAGAGRKTDAAPVPLPTPTPGHDAVDQDQDVNVDLAANLERAASSGLASTSSSGVGRAHSITDVSPSTRKRGSAGSGVPGAKGRSPAGRRLEPREYTAQLSAATSVQELQLLFEWGREQDMNAIHVATLWSRLAKLVSSPASPSTRTIYEKGPAAAPNSASATASPAGTAARGAGPTALPDKAPGALGAAQAHGDAGTQQPQPQPQSVAAFVEALQATTTPEQLERMEPRGLANVLWAAAKLKPHGGGAATAAAELGAAPPAATAGGTGLLEHHPHQQQQHGVGQEEVEGQGQRQRPPRIRGGKTALAAAKAKAAKAAAEERAGGRSTSEALLEAWAVAAGRKLASFNAQDLSNVVWALGRLGYQPPGLFMKQLSVALLKELPGMERPQQLSNVLLGLALLRFVPPIKDFWPAVWLALNRVVLADQKVPDVQGVSNTLWSLGQLAAHCSADMPPVPADVVSRAVFRTVQWGSRMSATQVQDVFTSLPHLGFGPSEYQASKLLGLVQRVLPGCDGRALSNILMALLQMRVRLPRGWTRGLLEAFHRQLSGCSLEAIGRMLFCLGTIRFTRPKWLPEVWSRLQRDVHLMTASDIAFTVLAIDRLYPELARRESTEPEEEEGEAAEGEEQPRASSSSLLEEEEGEGFELPVRLGGDSAGGRKRPEAGGDGDGTQGQNAAGEATAAAAEGAAAGGASTAPSRELLVALRDTWEATGPEEQLSVVFAYRAYVQEFFAAALPA